MTYNTTWNKRNYPKICPTKISDMKRKHWKTNDTSKGNRYKLLKDELQQRLSLQNVI